MANELQYAGYLNQAGLTVSAKLYSSAGSQIGSTIACTEAGDTAIYKSSMPTAPADQYLVRFFNGATLLGQGQLNWDGTKEILSGISDKIEALNDFNPASDEVAKVALVTANTDMRGTDNANTVAPNNTGIANILAGTNELQTNQGDWVTATGFSTLTALQVWTYAQRALTDKSGFTLTASQHELMAVAVESHLLDEADGQTIINAIVGAIGNSNIDELVLVSAIRNEIERSGGVLDGLPLLSEIEASNVLALESTSQSIKAKTDAQENADLTGIATAIDVTTAKNSVIASIPAPVSLTPVLNEITIQTADLKGANNKDLSQVFSNTPAIDLTAVIDAIQANGVKIDALDLVTVIEIVQGMTAVAEDFKADVSNLSTFDSASDDVKTSNADKEALAEKIYDGILN